MTAKPKRSRELSGRHAEKITIDASKANILLVDDLADKILSYEAILEELDQNIIIAHSGEEALKLILKHDFAVILLDVNMPGMDGFETASMIRKRKKSSHTPIIFLTAFPDEIRMAQGYATGAVDYLLTPVMPETLKAKVKVFIELSQMHKLAALQAEEAAHRKAAEDSANRFAFLVRVSETLERCKSYNETLSELLKLSVSYVSDLTMIWLKENQDKPELIKWVRLSEGKENFTDFVPSIQELPWLEEVLNRAVETGQPQLISEIPASLFLKKNANATLSGAALIVPLINGDKRNGAIALFRKKAYIPNDISMVKSFASRITIALENITLIEKIKEGDKRKNEFLAMLAHELRNPLAPIRNSLHVLKNTGDNNIRHQAEETIDRQLKHMIHLVDDLMDISRITQGKIELRKEKIKLKDVLDHAIETASPLIKQREHSLRIDLPKKDIWLDADFARASQIFSNLLNNASKYTNTGGEIELSVKQSGDEVLISVSDNGIGIAEDMLPKIFEMFSQVDSSLERSQGGLGIGLTLGKSLVEMHGGTIEASSKGINKGSKFTVKLPVTEQLEVHAEEQKIPEEKNKTTLRVLIVDDNEASAKTLGWMIELAGHDIKLAHDGKTALEIAQKYEPSVVLLDIGLPGMNGYEVCKTMQQSSALKNTIFIAQTGWSQEEHKQRSKEAGFNYHFVKPIDMDELQKVLNDFEPRQ